MDQGCAASGAGGRALGPSGSHCWPLATGLGRSHDGLVRTTEVGVQAGAVQMLGTLSLPDHAPGIVVFAHGSGSSRHSPRNRFVASALHRAGLATLLFDLLTPAEEADRANVFDIDLLARRLIGVTTWLSSRSDTRHRRIG